MSVGVDLYGWSCIYECMWYICVIHAPVPTGNTFSALVLIRHGSMELWQPRVCCVARFGSP